MSKQINIIIILSLFVFACTGSLSGKKPDNLIPKDKMSNILYDLYTINAAKGVNRKLLEQNGFVPETYVLTKYNIDSAQFAESNTYYTFDNDEYKAIIEAVKARLEKDKKAFETLRDTVRESEKAKSDSIKQLGKKTKDSIKNFIDKKGFKLDSLVID